MHYNDTLLRLWTIFRHHLAGLDPAECAAEALMATCYNAHGLTGPPGRPDKPPKRARGAQRRPRARRPRSGPPGCERLAAL